jgi:hypothetical protein
MPADDPAAIEIEALAAFEVAADGLAVRMSFRARDGGSAAIVLPSECMASLLMTLPRMIERALRLRHRDPTLLMAYPAEDWRLQLAGDGRSHILSLATGDRFEVSFALSPDMRREIAEALADADAALARRESGMALN